MITINELKISNGLRKKIVGIAILGIFLIPSVALAQWTTSGGPNSLINDELGVVLENILIYIIGFIGILGIIFLVYGGIRYVTSAGNDSEMEEAKKIIMYAVIGLFIAGSAYAIVKTIINLAS